MCLFFFFFFKQKTAYERRISDWSSDVCSSDLPHGGPCFSACRLPLAARRSNETRTPPRRLAPVTRARPGVKLLPGTSSGTRDRDERRRSSEERRGGNECVSACSSRGSV